MLLDAAVLAALAGISFVYLSEKIPPRLREFFKRNVVIADATAFLVAYTFFGGTIPAVLAGILLVGVVESLLYVANNPDDFLYLWDLKREVEEQLKVIKSNLKEYGQEYKMRSLKVVDVSAS